MGKKDKRRERNPNVVPLGVRRLGVEEKEVSQVTVSLRYLDAGKVETEEEQTQLEWDVDDRSSRGGTAINIIRR